MVSQLRMAVFIFIGAQGRFLDDARDTLSKDLVNLYVSLGSYELRSDTHRFIRKRELRTEMLVKTNKVIGSRLINARGVDQKSGRTGLFIQTEHDDKR